MAALQVSGPRADVVAAVRALAGTAAGAKPSPMRRALDRAQRAAAARHRAHAGGELSGQPDHELHPGAVVERGVAGVGAHRRPAVSRSGRRAQMAPFLSGAKPAIAEPYLLTSLAGHQAFARPGGARRRRRGRTRWPRKAADFILGRRRPTRSCGSPRRGPTTCSWPPRCWRAPPRARATPGMPTRCARLLTTYAARLQRDRRPVHPRRERAARLGPRQRLRRLRADGGAHASAGVVARPRRAARQLPTHMVALRRHQAPDGAWHQVIDEPGTYREFTVTAMT